MMRELSLNILDVAQNSITAGASLITIEVNENTIDHTLLIGIYDNGKGMSEEQVRSVIDPFFTTRTTRKVGMGIPLFKMAAEQTGGGLEIKSELGVGTEVRAYFKTDSVDFTPLGDVASTVQMLITMNTDRDFVYKHIVNEKEFVADTREIKEILGDVPLDTYEVSQWLLDFIKENTEVLYK
ncbi:MAG: ATP-binding protein [Clostridia bacterium]|nr:ATP-binding protein [Clostridia bacterium]